MPIQLTHRDEQTLLALQKLPLTSQQLFELSETFSNSFPSERVLRRRMQRLGEEGMVRRFYYAFPTNGRSPAYWRLTRASFRLLNGMTGQDPLPRRSFFSPMGVSLHFHTHSVAQVVVRLLVDAHRNGIEVEDLEIENGLEIGDGEKIVPDVTLTLRCSEGKQYLFFLELDTGSERVRTLQKLPSSIQKKLEFYERYRRMNRKAFRVLFVTTSSKQRALNILRFGAGLTNNYSAQSIYASFLPDLLSSNDSVTDHAFINHRLEVTHLIRKPRFCQLAPIVKGRDRIIAQLSQREFTPLWKTANNILVSL